MRAQLLGSLSVHERRLLAAVCCSRLTLRGAARELELPVEEAGLLWRRLGELVARAAQV